MLHAVIMAGGSGTRFWPESRKARPKQLLRLSGDKTLIRATLERLSGLAPPERTMVVTNQRLVVQLRQELPELSQAAILGEPCQRDTAPCIGLAAMLLARQDPDATLAVMPADHRIEDAKAFRQALELGAALVEEDPRRLVTFGIRPTYAAESFGYIERGESLPVPPNASSGGSRGLYRVLKFREKPKAAVAAEYLASGRFYWNAGIFVWKAKTILAALAERLPETYARLRTIADAADRSDFEQVLDREFAAIEPISIDYAILEHSDQVVVAEPAFDWDDVGSWQALARIGGADPQGNTITGKHLVSNTTKSIIRSSDDHLVVTLGVSDLIIVHTDDVTLVANRHDEESIRQLVKLLEDRGDDRFL